MRAGVPVSRRNRVGSLQLLVIKLYATRSRQLALFFLLIDDVCAMQVKLWTRTGEEWGCAQTIKFDEAATSIATVYLPKQQYVSLLFLI